MIWLTRPLEDSRAMQAALAAERIPSLVAPLMRIEPHATLDLPATEPDALFVTSRHGAAALAQVPWRHLPVYAVGEATAAEARNHGFTQVVSGMHGALELLPQVLQQHAEGATILYLSGEEMKVDVPALLTSQHRQVVRCIAYRSIAETTLPDALIHAIEPLRGVVFFSPRSAAIANQLLTQAGMAEHAAHMDAYCFSLDVASVAGALPWQRLHSCAVPTMQAMMELLRASAIRAA